MNAAVITGIISGSAVIIGALIAWVRSRKREKAAGDLDTAQAAKVIQGAALEMLEPLRARIGRLEKHIGRLETKVQTLTDELDAEREARLAVEQERDHLRLLLGSDQKGTPE